MTQDGKPTWGRFFRGFAVGVLGLTVDYGTNYLTGELPTMLAGTKFAFATGLALMAVNFIRDKFLKK